jgi:hypothetical protein
MVFHNCNPSCLFRRQRQEDLKFKASLGKKVGRPCHKNKRTRSIAQVGEHLSRMFEALNYKTPSTEKQTKHFDIISKLLT